MDCPSLRKRVRIDYQEMLYKGWFSFRRRISSFISWGTPRIWSIPRTSRWWTGAGEFILRDVSSRSGTDVPLAGEALKTDYTLPMCAEMTANCEEEFFSSLSASTSQNSPHDDSDEDVIEVNVASKEPKVKSLKEAMVILEDVIEYLASENQTETANDLANDLSKVLSNIPSTWLSRKLKASVQSKVTDFFEWIHCRACFNNNTIQKFYSESMMNDREVSSGWTCYCYSLQIKQRFLVKLSALVFISIKNVSLTFSLRARLTRTPWHVPSVSVLTGFHCSLLALRASWLVWCLYRFYQRNKSRCRCRCKWDVIIEYLTRASFQLTASHVVHIIIFLSGMFLLCWQKCGPKQKMFLQLNTFSMFVDHVILTYLRPDNKIK